MRLDNASKVRLATLGQLAAQLAHEIGTPLSSVSGHVQLALRERELPPALRERLDVSAREIERISKIVRDYLDSTRPLEPERQPTALPRLLEEAVEIVQGVAPARQARVTWKVTPETGDLVTDPGLLRQIVVNLLSNALDAIDRNGRVEVEARPGRRRGYPDHRERHRPRHPARRSAAHLRAVLHDQGTGQGHRPRPRHLPPAHRGAGRNHHGRERVGQGIDLLRPAAAPGAAGRRVAAACRGRPGVTQAKARVLVAEDDRVARDLLCEILRGEGYEVEAVDDGAGAVERAQEGRYDLVVSDVRMERSGGLDVLAAFISKAPSTPVILITAFGDVAGAMEAIQRGAYDYVSKPFNIEELRLTVARALERKRLVAEQKAEPSEKKTQPAGHRGQEPGDAGGVQAGGARRDVDGDRAGRGRIRARARSWSRAPSTRTRRAPGRRSCPSTARR